MTHQMNQQFHLRHLRPGEKPKLLDQLQAGEKTRIWHTQISAQNLSLTMWQDILMFSKNHRNYLAVILCQKTSVQVGVLMAPPNIWHWSKAIIWKLQHADSRIFIFYPKCKPMHHTELALHLKTGSHCNSLKFSTEKVHYVWLRKLNGFRTKGK